MMPSIKNGRSPGYCSKSFAHDVQTKGDGELVRGGSESSNIPYSGVQLGRGGVGSGVRVAQK